MAHAHAHAHARVENACAGAQAGFEGVEVSPRRGFAHFRGRKRPDPRA